MIKVKRLLRIIMPIVAICCAVVFVPWSAVWIWIKPLPDSVQQQVNEAINYGADGIIVYVDQPNKAPALYAAGWKNKANKVPADANALFKIASISKLYIAVATAKLVNTKLLSLDNTLAELLPELGGRIENADKITLKMMVQHRSGIPNYTDSPEFPWLKPFKEIDKALSLILDKPADFKPDSRYSYSNTNYILIGKILDKKLGYSHRQYIKTAILDKLGLTHTYSLLSEVNQDDLSSGYGIGYDEDFKTIDIVYPGGSMIATAQDVGIFLKALNKGTLLNAEEQAIYSSIYVYEHTGLVPGYQSIARYHKDIDTVIIQFTNTNGGDMWTISEAIYSRILKIVSK